MSRNGHATITDVARAAHVSLATVSRYYNAPEKVRPETRKTIEAAIKELRYVRNKSAISLQTQKFGAIGMVVPTLNNAIFAEMIQAFSSKLLEQDYTLLLSTHNYDLTTEAKLVTSLIELNADGIVLIGLDHDQAIEGLLRERQVPSLCAWNVSNHSIMPCVGFDNFAAGRVVSAHILELGHREIAIISGERKGNDRVRNRFEGIFSNLAEAGVTLTDARIKYCPYDVIEARDIAKELLLKEPSLTAIIAGNDTIAQGIISAADQLSLRIPEQLSVIGIGDFSPSVCMVPPLTTLRIPARRIGVLAAETIVQMIAGEPIEFVKEIPLELKIRASTTAVSY